MAVDSVYSRCSECIAIAENRKKLAIQADRLTENIQSTVNLSDMSRGELERRYIRQMVATCLHDHGYRSVINGRGFYVNPEIAKKIEYIEAMLENAKENELAKKIKRIGIQQLIDEIKANYESQMYFDDDSGMYKTNPTVDELLEMLAADS